MPHDMKMHGQYLGLSNGKSTTVRKLAKKLRKQKGLRAAIAFLKKARKKVTSSKPKRAARARP